MFLWGDMHAYSYLAPVEKWKSTGLLIGIGFLRLSPLN